MVTEYKVSTIIVLLALFLAYPLFVQGKEISDETVEWSGISVGDLVASCKNHTQDVSCTNYIDGLIDGYLFNTVLADTQPIFCFPHGTSKNEVADLFVQASETQPKSFKDPASSMLFAMLNSAFPCH